MGESTYQSGKPIHHSAIPVASNTFCMRGRVSSDGVFERGFCWVLAALICIITTVVIVFALK
jgi:hypothetical protein